MSAFRWMMRSVPTAFGAVALSAATAAADQPLFVWNGTVDREVLIVMRGRSVDERGTDSRLPSNTRVVNALPRTTGDVRVRVESGRGRVQVIEQPSSRNNYQTVVRITDPQGGSDRYRISAVWVGDDRHDDRRGNDRDDNNRVRDRDCVNNNGNGRGWGYGRDNDRNNDRNNRGRNDRDRNDCDRGRDNRGNNGGVYGNNGGYGNNGNLGAGTLRWSGRVDDVTDIVIRGRSVDYQTRSGAQTSEVRSQINGGGLPRRDGQVQIVSGSGRGSVTVVQQPNSSNGYTAVIRVSDQRAGAAYYDFEARWY